MLMVWERVLTGTAGYTGSSGYTGTSGSFQEASVIVVAELSAGECETETLREIAQDKTMRRHM